MSVYPWFRFYDRVVDDPELQLLPDRLFKAWVNFMCIANKNEPRGFLPPIDKVAYRLHITVPRAEALLAELVAANLFEWVEGMAHAVDWEKEQFESDNSTARVHKFREKQREKARNATGNVTRNVSVMIDETPGETDQRQTQSQKTEDKTPLVPQDEKTDTPPPSASATGVDGIPCIYCGATQADTGKAHEVDHFIPRSKLSSSLVGNRVMACHICNQAKTNRVFETIEEAKDWLHHAYWNSNRKRWIHHRQFAFGGLPPADWRDRESDFLRFWDEYPKHVSKEQARQAFMRIQPDADLLEQMLQAVRVQKRSIQWTKDGGQYVPNASTWLNNRRWTDEPPEPTDPHGRGNLSRIAEFMPGAKGAAA